MMEALGEAPPVSVQSLVTEDSIVKALQETLPSMNADTATLKVVMQKLAVRFEMEFPDFKAQWRPRIKALLPDMIDLCPGGDALENESEKADADAQEAEEEEEEEVDLRPSRKRTERISKNRNAVVDASDEEDGEDEANDSDTSEDEAAKSEEDDDDEGEDEDDGAPAKTRRTTSDTNKSRTKKRKSKNSAMPAKKLKMAKQADPPGLVALKELGRAAGVLNPRVYKLLKGAESTKEAEEILRERLCDAGVAFHGSFPTTRDISAAKRKHAKEKELEGIDTNLIIRGSRSRRGGGERISYMEERISGEEDNVEEEEDDDKEDAEEEVEESAASDSDSSEASF